MIAFDFKTLTINRSFDYIVYQTNAIAIIIIKPIFSKIIFAAI